MPLSDEELMNRVKVGDQEAFAELYDRHAPRLNGLITKLLGERCGAEDVLQDTFWQVWSRAVQYDARRARPVAWLALIARSRALDHLRLSRRRDPNADGARAVAEPDADAARRESLELTRASLGRLPEQERRVLSLAFYGGLTHREIARRQDIPLGTVKTHIRRGMQRMRKMLNGEALT